MLGGSVGAELINPTQEAQEFLEGGKHDIGLYVHTERQTVALTVLREIADAVLDGVLGASDVCHFPLYVDFACFNMVRAENRACRLGASGSHKACKSEDFPALQFEARILQ